MLEELRKLIENIEAVDSAWDIAHACERPEDIAARNQFYLDDRWTEITNGADEVCAAVVREYLAARGENPERIEEYITGIYDACDGWAHYIPPDVQKVEDDYERFRTDNGSE